MAKLLVVDDDQVTRDLVARVLQGDGHTVVAVADGQEALDLLAAGGFALMVADVDMPAMDGVTLARQAVGQQPGLAVVFMSGHAEGATRAREFAAPSRCAYVSKPFTADGLKATVRSLAG